MDMKIVKSEYRLCTCCMEEHEVKTVQVMDRATFKGESVEYEASYLYCDLADEFYMNEQQIQENDIRLKDAYRKKQGLLTSSDIRCIRLLYGISQSDLCILLGWGGKTITRYEGHQVQDKAHDTILKKISRDPEWFLSLLREAKDDLDRDAYQRYFDTATMLYRNEQDEYLRKTITANYTKYQTDSLAHGNTSLSLNKVVDVIRYFSASPKVSNLYKVKLMKMMWYADMLSFKKRGTAITGLVYQALPMGAVPIGHNLIIDLKDIPCEEVDMGEANAYHFSLKEDSSFDYLTEEEKEILDQIIARFGKMTKDQIVAFMHKERAYIETTPRDVILFEFAKDLQI